MDSDASVSILGWGTWQASMGGARFEHPNTVRGVAPHGAVVVVRLLGALAPTRVWARAPAVGPGELAHMC